MTEKPRSDVTDGVSWWCRRCKRRKTIRDDSFFNKSRLTLQQWLLLIYWWARQYPVSDAANEAQVDRGTAVDVIQMVARSVHNEAPANPNSTRGTWNYCSD